LPHRKGGKGGGRGGKGEGWGGGETSKGQVGLSIERRKDAVAAENYIWIKRKKGKNEENLIKQRCSRSRELTKRMKKTREKRKISKAKMQSKQRIMSFCGHSMKRMTAPFRLRSVEQEKKKIKKAGRENYGCLEDDF
jgi:hypothetical protein